MKISFIGFGNMAQAIAEGLIAKKDYQLWAAAPSLSIQSTAQGINTHHDNLAIITDADIIVLAVKPSLMPIVFAEIQSKIPANCLIISIAAGLSASWFNKQASSSFALVRAMPNIAASVGQSATPLFANELVSTHQRQAAEQIFSTIGLTTWVKQESDIDAFTALSGSGPAYIFLFMETMINAAKALGLSEEIATSFTLQTFRGALSLASTSELSLGELRNKVTSPAGTTAAAIAAFTAQGLEAITLKAMKAAYERAQQLAQQH